jgi:hypothetical protein
MGPTSMVNLLKTELLFYRNCHKDIHGSAVYHLFILQFRQYIQVFIFVMYLFTSSGRKGHVNNRTLTDK